MRDATTTEPILNGPYDPPDEDFELGSDRSTGNVPSPLDLQLEIYAEAKRRDGPDARGAYVHDVKTSSRTTVDVSPPAAATAELVVAEAAERLRHHDFTPSPGPRCRTCEVRTVCRSAVR